MKRVPSSVPPNKDEVNRRILETTRETERLKEELQTLIASGIRGPINVNSCYFKSPKDSSKQDKAGSGFTSNIQVIKSYDSHALNPKISSRTVHCVKAAEEFQEHKAETVSPKKPKGYNVEEAREYIKKQREKRLDEMRYKKTQSKSNVDLRKEKLQELQQKALELVKKNVESKKCRSTSRDPAIIRSRSASRDAKPDIKSLTRARSISREKVSENRLAQINLEQHTSNQSIIFSKNCAEKTKRHIAAPDSKLLKPPKSNFGGSLDSLQQIGKKVKHNSIIHKVSNKSDYKSLSSRDSDVRPISKNSNLGKLTNLENVNNKISESNTQKADLHLPFQSYNNNKDKSIHLLCPPDTHFSELARETHQLHESQSVPVIQIDDLNNDKNQRILFKSATSNLQKDITNAKNGIEIISNVILSERDEKDDVEQTKQKKCQHPEWLREVSPQGDPYNFINTVKRQLKYVVSENKPFSVDVGVQGNMEEPFCDLKLTKSSKHTDLKSFISHKCLNLDPKLVDHIELDKKEGYLEYKDGPTITKSSGFSGSESDTSKNIPSISSESGTSLKRNAESVKQLSHLPFSDHLGNVQKYPNLECSDKVNKVIPISCFDHIVYPETVPSKRDISKEDIDKIKKQLFQKSEGNSYSSDFNLSSSDLVKSRDSIISFNCAKVSPNKVPSSITEASVTPSDIKSAQNLLITEGSSKTNNDKLNKCQDFEKTSKTYSESKTKNITTRSVSGSGCSELNAAFLKKSISLSDKLVGESQIKTLSSISDSQLKSRQRSSKSNEFKSLLSDFYASNATSDPILSENLQSVQSSKEFLESQARSSNNVCSFSTTSNCDKEGTQRGFQNNNVESCSGNSYDKSDVRSFSVLEKNSTFTNKKQSSNTSSDSLTKKRTHGLKNTRELNSKYESDVSSNKENLSLNNPKLLVNLESKKKDKKNLSRVEKQDLLRNISVRSGRGASKDTDNEIHLKFEAEIHLLNDFNKSLQHFSEIEKAFESLQARNNPEPLTTKVLRNRDTQTSIVTKTSTKSLTKRSKGTGSEISTINFSRGSGIESYNQDQQEVNLELTTRSDINSEVSLIEFAGKSKSGSVISSRSIEDLIPSMVVDDHSLKLKNLGSYADENMVKNVAGISLRMFDQLIKDEDARIENLKKIVKIREQALLDRTRSELVFLEIQKKQLVDTGKMQEASLIKKKQRGILLKHQQERQEMQRLKQMQKEASNKRKALLKEEKNFIKIQVISNNIMPKLKPSSYREKTERRHSGPLRVLQATELIHSDNQSLSKDVPEMEPEVKSITARTHSITILSEVSNNWPSELEPLDASIVRGGRNITTYKKTLLMREHALAKRRKTVEELLQWHKKLLEEEKAIEALENKAGEIISKIPSKSKNELSKESNYLQTSAPEKSVIEEKALSMSQTTVDRIQVPSDNTSLKSKLTVSNISSDIPQDRQEGISSEESNKAESSTKYSTDFETESVPEVLPQRSDEHSSISSISQLIDDLSKIEGNILNLSLTQRKPLSQDNEKSLVENNEIITSSENKHDTFDKCEDLKTNEDFVDEIVDEDQSEISSYSSHIESEIDVKKLQPKVNVVGDKLNIVVEEASKEESKENKLKSEAQINSSFIMPDNNCSVVEINHSDNIVEKTDCTVNGEVSPLTEDLVSIVKDSISEHVPKSLSNIVYDTKEAQNNIGEEISIKDDEIQTKSFVESEVKSMIEGKDSESYESSVCNLKSSSSKIMSSDIVKDLISNKDEVISSLKNDAKSETSERTTDKVLPTEPNDQFKSSIDSNTFLHIPTLDHSLTVSDDNIYLTSQSLAEFVKKVSSELLLSEKPSSTSSHNATSKSNEGEIQNDLGKVAPVSEEECTEDQVSSISKEELGSVSEELIHPLASSSTNLSDREKDSDERQFSENKTDEEKVASLSNERSLKKGVLSEKSDNNVKLVVDSSSSSSPSRVSYLEGSNEPMKTYLNKTITDSMVESGASVSTQNQCGNLLLQKEQPNTSVNEESGTVSESDSQIPSLSQFSTSNKERSLKTLPKSNESSKRSVTEEKSGSQSIKLGLSSLNTELSPPKSSGSSTKSLGLSEKSPRSPIFESTSRSLSDKSNVSPRKSGSSSDKSTSSSSKSPVDVKKRVQQILHEASPISRGDKSPKMQDLMMMTYDLLSPTQSPDSGTPLDERKSFALGHEAEELFRKQIAIEQEIKLLTEQQQRQQIPLAYIREIPNKPPPPYTPPSKTKNIKTSSVVPGTKEEIEQITEYCAKIIYKAYLSSNLDNISVSDNTLNLIAKNIDKGCYKYVFDLCKEIAIDHYRQFEQDPGPSWLRLKKPQIVPPSKPLDANGLKKLMSKKLLELFGFEKTQYRVENVIMKWSRKKRDHVDEVLLREMISEESSWTNFEKDELIVKDKITNEIMGMLLKETAEVLRKTVERKNLAQ